MSNHVELDLYIDESGKFYENSYDPAERAAAGAEGKVQKFPSQLAGVLTPANALTEDVAEGILKRCFEQVGWDLPSVVHMERLVKKAVKEKRIVSFKKDYNTVIRELLTCLGAEDRKWQLVLLVNREGVSYGNMIQTYTNLVAELFLKTCRQKWEEGNPRIRLNLICSELQVQLPSKRKLRNPVYHWRVREYQAVAAVRQGFAPESSQWRLGTFETREDDRSRILQICDVLTHASHKQFHWCEPATKTQFKNALGEYSWTMVNRDLLERVEQLMEEHSLGVALLTLAEPFLLEDKRAALIKEAKGYLSNVLDGLAEMTTPVRDSQLLMVLSWLEQVIILQRDLSLGIKIADWLLAEVEAKLRIRLGGQSTELDWFVYGIRRWKLTAHNHQGALIEARAEATEIIRLVPALAGRWEHFTLLTEGLIARAVHLTDCFEFGEASRNMKVIAERFEGLANAFTENLPQLLPQRAHSDLRAKALGTWLQSEMFGAKNGNGLALARELNDAAIAEFQIEDFKQRQFQYRCQIETLAGEFAVAREFLGKSLHAGSTHALLADAIDKLAHDPVEQGFALMHWLRLGSAILLSSEASAEGKEFARSLDQSKLGESQWCIGQHEYYPAHSILRRLATVYAVQGRPELALLALDRLRRLDSVKDQQVVLSTILLAAQAEVAAILWIDRPEAARRLLSCETASELGIKELVPLIRSQSDGLFPAIVDLTESYASVVDDLLRGDPPLPSEKPPKQRLLELGQLVAY